jgi:hypothetical protein
LEVYDLARTLLFSLAGGVDQQSGTVQLDAGTYILRVRHRPDSENSSEPTDYLLEVQ